MSFAYDAAGRRVSRTAGGTTTNFLYDGGKILLEKQGSTTTATYTYDHHDKLTAAGSKTYGYDLNGNCTTVSVGTNTTTLTYDIENRVVGISYPGGGSNSFAYNGDDLRTQKVDSSGTQNYVTDGSSPASAVLKDGNAVYTPGLSERRGSASKFYHGDALGSTRGITDSTQSVTDSQLYDAFGNTVSRTGTTPTPFGFVGKAQYQSDSDSGLQLLGHRYYDPSIGRFLSSDPAKAGTNWYAYCDNNPLKSIDPTGLIHIVITIDPKTHLGTMQIYADEGDCAGGGIYGPIKGGTKLGEFPIGNKVKNPKADPTEVGGEGPFPPGTWKIGEIIHAPNPRLGSSKGVGTIKIGIPGDPPYQRGTEIHGGQGSHTHPTDGCVRTDDDDWTTIADILEHNKKRNNRVTVQ